MIEEIWKEIPGTDGYYHVSNNGRIMSTRNFFKERGVIILKQYLSRNYLFVALNGCSLKKKQYYTHRLVATAFISNPENKTQVNHKDGNKENNCVENLEWCTPYENTRHSNENGLVNITGENNTSCKLTSLQVLEIFNSNVSSKKICLLYNTTAANVRKIRNGLIWNDVTRLPKRRTYVDTTK
jgi:hypothetical protein